MAHFRFVYLLPVGVCKSLIVFACFPTHSSKPTQKAEDSDSVTMLSDAYQRFFFFLSDLTAEAEVLFIPQSEMHGIEGRTWPPSKPSLKTKERTLRGVELLNAVT